MSNQTWTKEQVPQWKGKMPEIRYGFSTVPYAQILWNGKILAVISYAREQAVHAEAKRKRVKYMKLILEGKIQ